MRCTDWPPNNFAEQIRLTEPLLPDLARYERRLEAIWQARWLTNHGGCVQELEGVLADYLQVPQLSLLSNGTLALMIALHALDLEGEVLTTPFTFPATVHALSWLGLEPVFCDIDPLTLTLDPEQCERAVGPRTCAILGVHLFGNPCDLAGLSDVADRHGLRLVFDAAHAFGTKMEESGIGRFGDVSMFSLHATKLFHTAEGGILCTNDEDLKRRIDGLRNFGIKDETTVVLPGINAKMSELHAALGLEVLPMLDEEQVCRARIKQHYRDCLSAVEGLSIIETSPGVTDNQQYMVVRIREGSSIGSADQIYRRLRDGGIYARRYFNPLISDFPHYRHLPSAAPENLPVARRAVKETLCLPLYGALSHGQVERICRLVLGRS